MASAIAEVKLLGEKAKLRTTARAWDVPKSTMRNYQPRKTIPLISMLNVR